jgi:transcriptional regulator with GAF, ATPase, and Fis domain
MKTMTANLFNKEKLGKSVVEEWQNLINVVAEILDVPAGLITRVDRSEIEIFLTSQSKGNPYPADYKTQFPGSGWYCERTIVNKELLLIPNALKDPEWKDNAAVTGPHMISYIGLPIARPDGEIFGTLCFLDNKENAHNDLHIKLLGQIKKLVELSLRTIFDKDAIRDRDCLIDGLSKIYPICAYCKRVREKAGSWIKVEEYVTNISGNMPSHGVCPECLERERTKR